jgi:hypothetical protein
MMRLELKRLRPWGNSRSCAKSRVDFTSSVLSGPSRKQIVRIPSCWARALMRGSGESPSLILSRQMLRASASPRLVDLRVAAMISYDRHFKETKLRWFCLEKARRRSCVADRGPSSAPGSRWSRASRRLWKSRRPTVSAKSSITSSVSRAP